MIEMMGWDGMGWDGMGWDEMVENEERCVNIPPKKECFFHFNTFERHMYNRISQNNYSMITTESCMLFLY